LTGLKYYHGQHRQV